jgi:hypothetical protein
MKQRVWVVEDRERAAILATPRPAPLTTLRRRKTPVLGIEIRLRG